MRIFEVLKEKNSQFSVIPHTKEAGNVMACTIENHLQTAVELVCVLNGFFDYHIGGRTERIHAGEAGIIFPFQSHSYTRYEGHEYLRFDFDTTMAKDFFDANQNCVGARSVFKLSESSNFMLKSYFLNRKSYSYLAVQSFFYSVLNDLTEQTEFLPRSKDSTILSKTVNYITNNKEKTLTSESVAKALGYSKNYFSSAINKTAGFGFNYLLALIRTESAKMLLSGSRKTVLEIVLECGFGCERSFYRQFTNIVGISPLKYRDAHIKKHLNKTHYELNP